MERRQVWQTIGTTGQITGLSRVRTGSPKKEIKGKQNPHYLRKYEENDRYPNRFLFLSFFFFFFEGNPEEASFKVTVEGLMMPNRSQPGVLHI